MLKKIICFWVCVFSLPLLIWASGTYKIPEDIKVDLKIAKKNLSQAPDSHACKFEMAMAYAYSGQIKKGWDMLKQVPEPYADDVIKQYEPLEKKYPQEWRYPFKLAFGYYFKKDKQGAIDAFNRVLKIDPQHIWAMGFIGLVKGDMGKVDETIDICKKALEIEPNATAIHFLLGEAYRKKGQYKQSLSHFLKVGQLQTKESFSKQYDD